ncbi:MAG: T9SS type A sorting domain-containing protein [Bacteroidetes bacterium]|nr:T9SS type A sorting domain-containing protein [Bacteroidota bacterium]
MRQYWKDASGNHFLMEPYVTHPFATDYRLRTGIVNDYEVVDNRVIVKTLMMPYSKYGRDSNMSYFRSFSDNENVVYKAGRIMNDADTIVRRYYSNSFDLDAFKHAGGIIIYVFAGSQKWFKGYGQYENSRIGVRGRFMEITNMDSSRVDGISITAHELAHLEFNWGHSSAARYCIMNAYDRHNKDCPQFPNPILRAREGWIEPIEIRGTQSVTNLPPIETSNQCGVITIYGKPSAKPDWTCGESFFVENRKQIGFDKKILENNNPDNKPGGLLIWHYSPYKEFQHPSSGDGYNLSYELIAANGDIDLFNYDCNPDHFFAYKFASEGNHNLESNRTTSSVNLVTGISINDIQQNDYNDLYSSIRFNLNYGISEPPNYTYAINGLKDSSYTVTLHDTVYYHNVQPYSALTLSPGTVVESSPNKTIQVYGMKSRGTQNNPVVFKTVGYGSNRVNYTGCDIVDSNYSDSVFVDYCRFERILNPVKVTINSNSPTRPVVFQNSTLQGDSSEIMFNIYSLSPYADIASFKNNNFKMLNLKEGTYRITMNDDFVIPSGDTLILFGKMAQYQTTFDFIHQKSLIINGAAMVYTNTKTNADFNIGSNGIFSVFQGNDFAPIITFTPNTGINCSGKIFIDSKNNPRMEFRTDSQADTSYWNGIQCANQGNVLIRNAKIKKAKTGFSASGYTSVMDIEGCQFEQNKFADIKLDNSITSDAANALIHYNTFIGNSDLISSIVSDNILNVTISDNVFNDIYSNGVSLMYTTNPLLLNNQFYGTTQYNGGAYTGIYSYNSGGFYNCNTSTNFYDGILLDNSSPYLLNNEIWNNGYGLYLTNNSIPIMSPSYSQTQALYSAGYNKIYDNASDEIYCDNTQDYQLSYPYLFKGHNSIYDSTNSGYLVNLNYYFDPPLDAADNFWGGDNNYLVDKFNPQGSLSYDPYLTEPGFIAYCSAIIQNGDFSDMPSEALLLGSANIDAYNKNYSTAETKYLQLLNQVNRPYKTQNILSRLFNNMLISRGDFNSAVTFFETFSQQHPADTFICRKSHNLSIGSKVEQPNYPEAISDYNQLSMTSNYQKERYYATIDKMRTIRLMLDTLMNNYGNGMGGDHSGLGNGMGGDHFQLGNGLLNELENNRSSIINYLDGISRFSKTRGLINRTDTKFNVLNNATSANVSSLSKKEKIELISNMVLSSLVKNNVLINIPLKRPLNRVNSKFHKQSNKQESLIPKKYELSQNYPNPFNPTTTINYAIPQNGVVQIKIFDITGREIKSLVNETKTAGYYSITFNASDLSSGVYFYRIQAKDFIQTKRMVLIK